MPISRALAPNASQSYAALRLAPYVFVMALQTFAQRVCVHAKVGQMFWFERNTFSGSYFFLDRRSRSVLRTLMGLRSSFGERLIQHLDKRRAVVGVGLIFVELHELLDLFADRTLHQVPLLSD